MNFATEKNNETDFDKYLEMIALANGTVTEEVRKDIEISIADAYNSGNINMRLITKDGSMPTVDEFLSFLYDQTLIALEP
ncbi:MAG: hypothetical protein FWE13_03330 [Firmicutes bacterium]|nr:hypothetical protein [Bacillota bacterium]